MRAPNLSFACTYVRVFLTRAPWGSWNEWVKARDNKGPILDALARTRKDLWQALAEEDKEDHAVVELVAAEVAKEFPKNPKIDEVIEGKIFLHFGL